MILNEKLGANFDYAPPTDNGGQDFPTLSEVLANFGSLPREALFLGVADDALPVLLNLHDPTPGPLLVAADQGAGKTGFLQTVASAISKTKDASDVQFALISPTPHELDTLEDSSNCAGFYSSFDKEKTTDFIHSLGEWAHSNKSDQSVVLLLDKLENFASLDDQDAQDTLRWLLLRWARLPRLDHCYSRSL